MGCSVADFADFSEPEPVDDFSEPEPVDTSTPLKARKRRRDDSVVDLELLDCSESEARDQTGSMYDPEASIDFAR